MNYETTDRSIDAYVKRLRKKFLEIGRNIDPIETVHGLGYKLNQKIEDTQ
jgi:DNA-binding response OmpR family regulator